MVWLFSADGELVVVSSFTRKGGCDKKKAKRAMPIAQMTYAFYR